MEGLGVISGSGTYRREIACIPSALSCGRPVELTRDSEVMPERLTSMPRTMKASPAMGRTSVCASRRTAGAPAAEARMART